MFWCTSKDRKETCQSRLFAVCKILEFFTIWDKSTIQTRTQQRWSVISLIYPCVCVYVCVVLTTHWHLNKGTRLLLTSTNWTSCLSSHLTCPSSRFWTSFKAHLKFHLLYWSLCTLSPFPSRVNYSLWPSQKFSHCYFHFCHFVYNKSNLVFKCEIGFSHSLYSSLHSWSLVRSMQCSLYP